MKLITHAHIVESATHFQCMAASGVVRVRTAAVRIFKTPLVMYSGSTPVGLFGQRLVFNVHMVECHHLCGLGSVTHSSFNMPCLI